MKYAQFFDPICLAFKPNFFQHSSNMIGLFLTLLLFPLVSAYKPIIDDISDRVDVNTSRGPLFGFHVNYGQKSDANALYYGQGDIFLGIPYVFPPVKDLRYQVRENGGTRGQNVNMLMFFRNQNRCWLCQGLCPLMQRRTLQHVPSWLLCPSLTPVKIACI